MPADVDAAEECDVGCQREEEPSNVIDTPTT
jgi:hypothetical protein